MKIYCTLHFASPKDETYQAVSYQLSHKLSFDTNFQRKKLKSERIIFKTEAGLYSTLHTKPLLQIHA
jgi:hypothetical protein